MMAATTNEVEFFYRLHSLGLIHPFVRFSRGLREEILRKVNFNTDLVLHQFTALDLLTDSYMQKPVRRGPRLGKGRMEVCSQKLVSTVERRFGFAHVLPVAQGRSAELMLALARVRPGMIVPNNLLFPTTRYHQERAGATLAEIPVAQSLDPVSDFPFKGNLDVVKLEALIREHGNERIPYVYVEATTNASGGHPVSMENIRCVHELARRNRIAVVVDGCRLLENAWHIRERELRQGARRLPDLVLEFCSHADVCLASASKDFWIDKGGFIATRDPDLFRELQDLVFLSGDGLSVGDKAEFQSAIEETFTHESRVGRRVDAAAQLWRALRKAGVPVVCPAGGHAVFLDLRALHQHLPEEHCPDRAFLVEFYRESGILGGTHVLTDSQRRRGLKMVRLALPLGGYPRGTVGRIARDVARVWGRRSQIEGLRLLSAPPNRSGEFLGRYEPVVSKLGGMPLGDRP